MFFALALLAGACSPQAGNDQQAAAGPLAGARIGGPFSLVDQDGRRVTDKDFAGKYRIVYFGYSYCPDVCPVDLQKLMQGLRLFERENPAAAQKVQPLFITVDPVRDTPAALKTYVAAFHPRLVGLTGSEAEVAAAAKAYAVYYRKAENEGASEYLMDHSRQTYLMGPDGKPIALLPQDESPEAVAAELARWVR
ncbi:SCO family protein [Sphingomonas gilva]|nr:SCO family protein [Sphingomonas gilva]